MHAVVGWFVSTLFGSYHSRCSGTNSERKPFNPVLGESLECSYIDSAKEGWGSAHTQVEQVSHHPPVSAFAIKMPAQKPIITVQGHCGQRTVFSAGAVKVTQVGRVRIVVSTPGTPAIEYTIFPLPELTVAGLLSGKIFVELLGKTRIVCSNGRHAEIEFIPKGWFTGEYFQLKGFIKKDADTEYTFSGNWTKQTFSAKGSQERQVLFDSATPPHDRVYKPIEQQGPLESHKLWGAVTASINASDFATASAMKTEIEETQREIRKKRKEEGTTFTPQYFKFVVPNGQDLEGTTAQDPQQHAGVGVTEQGHWMMANVK